MSDARKKRGDQNWQFIPLNMYWVRVLLPI